MEMQERNRLQPSRRTSSQDGKHGYGVPYCTVAKERHRVLWLQAMFLDQGSAQVRCMLLDLKVVEPFGSCSIGVSANCVSRRSVQMRVPLIFECPFPDSQVRRVCSVEKSKALSNMAA